MGVGIGHGTEVMEFGGGGGGDFGRDTGITGLGFTPTTSENWDKFGAVGGDNTTLPEDSVLVLLGRDKSLAWDKLIICIFSSESPDSICVRRISLSLIFLYKHCKTQHVFEQQHCKILDISVGHLIYEQKQIMINNDKVKIIPIVSKLQ